MNEGERRHLAGKELFEIKPAILGGDPTDPANKVVLDREQHIEAVRYWNRLISDLRQAKARDASISSSTSRIGGDQ